MGADGNKPRFFQDAADEEISSLFVMEAYCISDLIRVDCVEICLPGEYEPVASHELEFYKIIRGDLDWAEVDLGGFDSFT